MRKADWEKNRLSLNQSNFKNVVEPLSPSFSGIVTGEGKGHLWLDNLRMPSLALAESYCVGSYAFLGKSLTAETYEQMKHFLYDELFPERIARQEGYFEFSIENDALRNEILELFHEKNIQQEKEFSFRYEGSMKEEICVPEGYELVKLTKELWDQMERNELEDPLHVKTRIAESWYSFEAFENRSLGYCVLHQGQVAAIIAGTCRYQNVIPIDIETKEEDKRKGLAVAMGIAFMKECYERGLIPQWDCVESNLISEHLAYRLGFQKIRENMVYWFDI